MKVTIAIAVLLVGVLVGWQIHARRDDSFYIVIEAQAGTEDIPGQLIGRKATYAIRHKGVIIHAECTLVVPYVNGIPTHLLPCPSHPNIPVGQPLVMTRSESGYELVWRPAQGEGVDFKILSEKAR